LSSSARRACQRSEGDGLAGFEAADDVEAAVAVVVEALAAAGDHFFEHGDGDEEAGSLAPDGAAEAGCGDANDLKGMGVDGEGGADDGGIGTEVVFPVVEAENDNGVGVFLQVVVLGEEAAEGWVDAENGEVVSADELGLAVFRGVVAGDSDAGGKGGDETVEGLVLVA